MSELSQLTPQPLWDIFAQICAIPHPSHHEEALAQHIMLLAKQHHIHAERDQAGNILLRKSATLGMEDRQSVVLQAHLDMVPQKNNTTQHDFIQDPIQPYIDGEWVKAKGTTLGADNGIGLASALAVLFAKDVIHGPLEVLLTMTEETGMVGAFALQPNWLQSNLLINTDSEAEGDIYTGCAGGMNFTMALPLSREQAPADYQAFNITLSGLKGGHSGIDIHLGLGNANKLMARFLFKYAAELAIRITDLNGGTLRNAIPREASVSVLLPAANTGKLHAACADYLKVLHHELGARENSLSIEIKAQVDQRPVLTQGIQSKMIAWLNSLTNGVIRMSDELTGVTETSLNLGVVTIVDDELNVVCLIRSLVDSAKHYVAEILAAQSQLVGATYTQSGDYPGWKPDTCSQLTQLTIQTYEKLFAITPNNMVIHAGLECGLFKKPYPTMDMISFGPTIVGAHSPDERVHINSVDRYWQLLTAILQAIPKS